MKFGLLLFLAASAFGQAITLTPSASVVYPGEPLTIAVTLGGNTTPAALQWTSPKPNVGVVAGAALTAAAKTVQCATVNGATTCLASGLNKTKIGDGVLATLSIPTAAPGALSFGLTNVLGATDAALPINYTTAPVSVTVTTRCDVDKSGVTNADDVNAYLPQFFGSAPCTQSLTGDGKCDVRSVIVLIFAALPGGSCSAK